MTPDIELRTMPLDELALRERPQEWRSRPDSLAETLAVGGQVGERFGLRIGDGAAGVLAANALSDDRRRSLTAQRTPCLPALDAVIVSCQLVRPSKRPDSLAAAKPIATPATSVAM
jgi:hypothetical protein